MLSKLNSTVHIRQAWRIYLGSVSSNRRWFCCHLTFLLRGLVLASGRPFEGFEGVLLHTGCTCVHHYVQEEGGRAGGLVHGRVRVRERTVTCSSRSSSEVGA
jgi:hypothetical protein